MIKFHKSRILCNASRAQLKINDAMSWFRLTVMSILCILSQFITGCSTDQNGFETLHFNVNRNLLKPVWTDSINQFSFCPPKDWSLADSLTLEKIRSRMKNEYPLSKAQNFDLITLFSDSIHTNFCSVTTVDFQTEMVETDSIIQFFDQQITEKFKGSEINQAKIKIDQYRVLQYRIIMPDQVLFKLIFINAHPEIIQLDYAIARSTFYETIESVESSIGTIHYFKKE